jgi:sugar lactone lactonase YvrE
MDPRVVGVGLVFPEGPRWHDGRLWLSDIHAHRVMRLEADGTWTVVAELADRPSGLGFLPDGTPLVVSLLDRCLLRLDGKAASVYADLSSLAGDFINDMVVDGEGRAYVGNRNPGSRPDHPIDTLILVQPDGQVRQVADGLSSPNGMVVTPDGGTLIVAETLVGRLVAFDIGPSGTLSGRRTFAQLADQHADGICLDADGAVWVGSPGHGLFLRVHEGGKVSDSVSVGDWWAVAPALGGADRRTLFMVTAKTTRANFDYLGSDRSRDAVSHSEGRVLAAEVTTAGAGWP